MGQNGAVGTRALGAGDKECLPWAWVEKGPQSLQRDSRVIRQRLSTSDQEERAELGHTTLLTVVASS